MVADAKLDAVSAELEEQEPTTSFAKKQRVLMQSHRGDFDGWKRTPHAFLVVFDAPETDTNKPKKERETNES